MDDIAIFGEVYQERGRRSFSVPTVRRYKGEQIPWVPHDCDGSRCSYCGRKKREFIASVRARDPFSTAK